MHGLIFETSICYWQDQPGSLFLFSSSRSRAALKSSDPLESSEPTGFALARVRKRQCERAQLCSLLFTEKKKDCSLGLDVSRILRPVSLYLCLIHKLRIYISVRVRRGAGTFRFRKHCASCAGSELSRPSGVSSTRSVLSFRRESFLLLGQIGSNRGLACIRLLYDGFTGYSSPPFGLSNT